MGTLVNTVNCVGVMGKGIAREFKLRYPQMYAHYTSVCKKKLLTPGKLLLWKHSYPWVLNFPTKNHWRYPSRIEYLEKGLFKFARTYSSCGIRSIAFPLLGALSGTLDPDRVYTLMERVLKPLPDIEIEIYTFDPRLPDPLFNGLKTQITHLRYEGKSIYGINKHILNTIADGISDGSIRSMADIHTLKGMGTQTLQKLYNVVTQEPEPRHDCKVAEQLSLF